MTLDVRANEQGLIRVFALSMPEAEAKALKGKEDALKTALGGTFIDADFTEVFPVSDLGDLTLPQYLNTGHGVPNANLQDDHMKLASLDGWVVLVFSKAFDGYAQTLSPRSTVTHIGTYAEDGVDWRPVPIQTTSAQPEPQLVTPGPQIQRPRAHRWVIGGALVLAALLILALTR